jgi:hypothetical protein
MLFRGEYVEDKTNAAVVENAHGLTHLRDDPFA